MMVNIKLTRDSVAAGDDVDAPHERNVELDSTDVDPAKFVTQMATGSLASVNGVGHSWSAFLNGQFIATITVNEIIPQVAELPFLTANDLYFKYHSAEF